VNSFDFKFGAAVYGQQTDYGQQNSCGHLARLVVDPESQCVSDTIVESGLLFKQSLVVPVSDVEDATAMGIHLAIGCQELAGYPTFNEMTIEHGAQSWVAPVQDSTVIGVSATGMLPTSGEMATVREKVRQGVDDNKLVLGNKTAVYGLDGRIGHLSHLITVNNEGQPCQIQYLVVTQGILLSKQFMIPVHYIQTLSEQGIHVLVADTEIGEFPEYYAPPAEMTEKPDVPEDMPEEERSV
jgi:hypothetical protein